MRIKPPPRHVLRRIKKWRLEKKFEKATALLLTDWRRSSLNLELLEPKHRGIYSFRLDKKYRALFFMEGDEVEVLQITKHYRK